MKKCHGNKKVKGFVQYIVKGLRNKDDGVAVIIGSIMLIAIFISLISTYLFWYLPYQGTLNEQNYYLQTESAFNSLESKMTGPHLVPGAFATQPIPLGIAGEPPFSVASDTSLSFSNYSSTNSFSLHLGFNLTFNTTNGHKNVTASEYYNSSGLLYTSAQMQYIINYGYAITNGLVIRNEGNQSGLISGTHFTFENNTNNFTLYTSLLNLSGKTETVGGYGSTILQAEYISVENQSLYLNSNATSYNTSIIGTISSINLSNLSLNITSPFARAIDTALISQYNISARSSSSHWFIYHALEVNLTGNNLLIKNIKMLKMETLSVEFSQAELLAL